ncbi:MAG: alpha-helical pore-forming toxin family protein [Microcystis aeruginosa G13-12]|nr:alpha-helical pore-forming toxin family protein [Microcystis aeruginosa SX13-11]NCR88035.1 alpha-helical pore-forming toxin family protein [Microcystis aeruginosa G13-10]NCS16786.1 alpha-helical pore-forming toxin family protein [Microcystis aeruginosa G13-12]NCS33505.1 alpha-helical pore-forming toxin family protein [Microcystis aeruginosa G11-01]NCT52646.1 alpha-helical pore-forming toxin family protein [Microcystis aeruginosa G13-03]NCT64232.1 alpha-helical pore-forming toxin family prot
MTTLRLIHNAATAENSDIEKLNSKVQASASSGLVVQGYCTQIMQQPSFVIPDTDTLKNFPDINGNLTIARGNAGYYLNTVQPMIIGVISETRAYSQQFKGFQPLIIRRLDDWKNGSTQGRTDALALINQLKNDVDLKTASAKKVADEIGKFRTKLNGDISNFNTAITQATTLIQGTDGDGGALASLNDQLSDLDGKIAGASVGVALSGLTVIGGGIMIAIGAIGTPFTGGASTTLIGVGVGVVVVGVGGLTASSVILANFLSTKSKLLQQKQQLKDSVIFLTGLKSSLNPLNNLAQNASNEVNNMYNAWEFLSQNLGQVSSSLESADKYSQLPITVQAYLNIAYGQWNAVDQSIETIQNQMTGVKVETPKDANGNPVSLTAILDKLPKAA